MGVHKMQTNFSMGEIAPGADQRTDLAALQNGTALMRNCKPLAQGGVRRRGGLQFCADVLTPGPYQHHDFVFNTEQTYQFLFRDGAVDIYDGATGAPVNFNRPGPWAAYMIGQLSVHSWNDLTFVCHPDMPPQQIRRESAVDFGVQPYQFATDASGVSTAIFQPYHRFARPDVHLLIEAQSGYTDPGGWAYGSVAQISCPIAYFTPNHVGVVLSVGDGQFQIFEYVNAQVVRAAVISPHVRLTLLPDALTIIASTTLVEVYQPFNMIPIGNAVMILNAQAFGLADYDKINGIHVATNGFSSGSVWYYNYTPTGPVLSSASVGGGPNIKIWTSHFGTLDWKEAMYSTARGYPHCVSSFQSRLAFGGGHQTPNRLNLSQVESPFNFDAGTGEDDESIQIGLSGRRTPIIRQIVGSTHLQIFTSEGEYYVPRLDNTAALTPKTASVLPQSPYGIRTGIPAIEFDGSTIFISKNAANLRQMVFGSDDDLYSAPNLALLATHLIPSPTWLTVQMEDNRYGEATAYVLNADRTLAAFTMVRSEKIAAWAGWSSGTGFRSACAVNGNAFFVVSRVIAGVERFHMVKLNHDRVLDGSVLGSFVGKFGQNYLWNGFALYAGQPITLVVDGWSDIGIFTPDGAGQVAIPVRANQLEGGFGFVAQVRTLAPEMVLPSGPSHGQMRRVICATIDFENSLGVIVRNSAGGRQTGQTKVLNSVAEGDLGLHAPVLNGKRDVWLMGWDDKGWIDIQQSSNAPMTLKSINLDVEF